MSAAAAIITSSGVLQLTPDDHALLTVCGISAAGTAAAPRSLIDLSRRRDNLPRRPVHSVAGAARFVEFMQRHSQTYGLKADMYEIGYAAPGEPAGARRTAAVEISPNVTPEPGDLLLMVAVSPVAHWSFRRMIRCTRDGGAHVFERGDRQLFRLTRRDLDAGSFLRPVAIVTAHLGITLYAGHDGTVDAPMSYTPGRSRGMRRWLAEAGSGA